MPTPGILQSPSMSFSAFLPAAAQPLGKDVSGGSIPGQISTPRRRPCSRDAMQGMGARSATHNSSGSGSGSSSNGRRSSQPLSFARRSPEICSTCSSESPTLVFRQPPRMASTPFAMPASFPVGTSSAASLQLPRSAEENAISEVRSSSASVELPGRTSTSNAIFVMDGGSRFDVSFDGDPVVDGNDEHAGGAASDGDSVSSQCCRICLEDISAAELANGSAIRLGCRCTHAMGLAHTACAARWFLTRRSTTCELCGSKASNLPESAVKRIEHAAAVAAGTARPAFPRAFYFNRDSISVTESPRRDGRTTRELLLLGVLPAFFTFFALTALFITVLDADPTTSVICALMCSIVPAFFWIGFDKWMPAISFLALFIPTVFGVTALIWSWNPTRMVGGSLVMGTFSGIIIALLLHSSLCSFLAKLQPQPRSSSRTRPGRGVVMPNRRSGSAATSNGFPGSDRMSEASRGPSSDVEAAVPASASSTGTV